MAWQQRRPSVGVVPEGIELPDFSEATVEGLRQALPEFASLHNPLDVTGYVAVDPSISQRALEVVVAGAEGSFDVVMYQTNLPREDLPASDQMVRRYDALAELIKSSPVPVVLQPAFSSELSGFGRQLVVDHGWNVLDGIEHGMTALGRTLAYHEYRERWLSKRSGESAVRPSGAHFSAPVPVPAGAEGVWSEHQLRPLLSTHGVPLVPATLARSPSEARVVAARLGGSVALKVAAPGLGHRSELGGVRLGVAPDQVEAAYSSLMEAVRIAEPDRAVEGVLVSPMRRNGVELLVGVTTDPIWGKVLTVGLGGIWVEILRDVSLRLLPVDREEIRTMVGELRGAPLLAGARGQIPLDLEGILDAVDAVARLANGLGDVLDSLELNPLLAQSDRVEALDALAVWATAVGVSERGP